MKKCTCPSNEAISKDHHGRTLPFIQRAYHVLSPGERCMAEKNVSIASGVFTKLRGGFISKRAYFCLSINIERRRTSQRASAPPTRRNGSHTGAKKSDIESASETTPGINRYATNRNTRPSTRIGHG